MNTLVFDEYIEKACMIILILVGCWIFIDMCLIEMSECI